jgi:hypothetical protein
MHYYKQGDLDVSSEGPSSGTQDHFPLSEFVRAKRKTNLGKLKLDSFYFFTVCANKFAKWKMGFSGGTGRKVEVLLLVIALCPKLDCSLSSSNNYFM